MLLPRPLCTLLLLALVGTIVTLVASCGDGDSDATPSPSAESATPSASGATPTPDFDEDNLEAVEQAVLSADDVPQGLVALASVTSTNEDVASAAADPDAQLAQLEEWGRLLGVEVTYQPGPAAPASITVRSLTTSSSLYEDPQGARDSYQSAIEEAEAIDWQLEYSHLQDVQVETMDAGGIGSDEAYWVRISGMGEGALTIDDYILMRSGVMRLFLRTSSVGDSRDMHTGTIESLAQAQLQRALDAQEAL